MLKFSLTAPFKFSNSRPLKKKKKDRDRSENERHYRVDIPEELVIEVLSRLPLKFLFRFKCGSKQWQWLISNTITVKNRPQLLVSSNFLGYSLFHTLDHEFRVEGMDLLRGEFRSSCNGLLLIQVNNQLIVWNPLTRFYKTLLTYCTRFGEITFADLCFDYANDLYKILLIERHKYDHPLHYSFYVLTCGARIYREIDVPDWVCNLNQGPFFLGYKHWIFKGRGDDPNHIAFFDPNKYEFVELPMPQPKNGLRDTNINLGVLDQYLCMTRWEDSQNCEENIELLVLRKYQNEESWDIMSVISNTPEIRRYHGIEPLFVTKDGEILICIKINYTDRIVRAFDIYGNFLRDITVPNFGKCFLNVISYEESFFSPLACYYTQSSLKSCDFEVWKYFGTNGMKFYDDFSWEMEYYGNSHLYYGEEYWIFYDMEKDVDFKEEFPSRKKKRNKKKSDHIRITNSELYKRQSWSTFSEIQKRKNGKKRNKRNYEGKCENSQRFSYI